MKALADKVVLVYDGDAAGAKAMKRAFPLFAQENLAVRALPLPAGMDPDNYAQAHGVEMFRSAWETAQPWFSYLLEDLITTHGLDIEGRVRVLEELRPYVQALTDPVEQDLWLRATSERLGVDEAALRKSLTSLAPISAARLDPRTNLAVSLEKAVLRWVLGHPEAVSPGGVGRVGRGVREPGTQRAPGTDHRQLSGTRQTGSRPPGAAGAREKPNGSTSVP